MNTWYAVFCEVPVDAFVPINAVELTADIFVTFCIGTSESVAASVDYISSIFCFFVERTFSFLCAADAMVSILGFASKSDKQGMLWVSPGKGMPARSKTDFFSLDLQTPHMPAGRMVPTQSATRT